MKPIQIIPILLICFVFFGFDPNDYYYHPWLEYPYYQSEMQGPLPPNSSTDDYVILFNAVGPTDSSMLGKFLCLAGDQNEDGYDDILIYCENPPETRLYFGGNPMDTIPEISFTKMENATWFGNMPNELPDINGDGVNDIIISNSFGYYYDEVYIYLGGTLLDSVPDFILKSDDGSTTGYEAFGAFMSCGDINGDNYLDLAIGAPNYAINQISGKLFIYYCGLEFDTIPDFTITSAFNDFGSLFGGSISASGDINNDEIQDIVTIWSKTHNPVYLTGAYLFYGNEELDSIPDWTYELPYGVSGYDTRCATIIKDLNNDNYDEIAVITLEGFGRETHVFFGTENLGNTPDLIIQGGSDGPRISVSAGDVNADGFNDLIFGNSYDDWVKVYFGGDPMDAIADITFYMDHAGFDVDFAGDINNDGIHDFMFSANIGSVFNPDPGEIFIYSDPSLTPHVKPRYKNSPTAFRLDQNFPNPFNGATVIPFQSNINGRVELNIYNILGQIVYFNSFDCTFGENVRILWDAKDLSGNILASGLYFAELIAEDYREAIKMEILR